MARAKPLENALYEEIVARLKQDDSTVPYRKNGYWYSTRFEPGKEHPIFVRRKDVARCARGDLAGRQRARPRDMTTTASARWRSRRIRSGSPSARTPSAGANSRCTSRIFGTRRLLTAAIPDVEPDLAWANDNRTAAVCREGSGDAAGSVRQEARAGRGSEPRCVDFRANRPELLHRRFQIQIGCVYFHPHMESTLSSEWRYARADDPQLNFEDFPAARTRS